MFQLSKGIQALQAATPITDLTWEQVAEAAKNAGVKLWDHDPTDLAHHNEFVAFRFMEKESDLRFDSSRVPGAKFQLKYKLSTPSWGWKKPVELWAYPELHVGLRHPCVLTWYGARRRGPVAEGIAPAILRTLGGEPYKVTEELIVSVPAPSWVSDTNPYRADEPDSTVFLLSEAHEALRKYYEETRKFLA